MATETTNLHLVKPDKEEYYDVDIQNGNWDKVDAKATEVDAALAGKAECRMPNLAACDLHEYILDTLPYSADFIVNGNFANIPYATSWNIHVELTEQGKYWLVVVATEYLGNSRYYQTYLNGTWSEWHKLATATPPTQYDLPLADGVTANGVCKYAKTQNGIVIIYGSVTVSTSAGVGKAIAFLPAEYRPSDTIQLPTSANTGAGSMTIYANGQIDISTVNASMYTFICALFIAGN